MNYYKRLYKNCEWLVAKYFSPTWSKMIQTHRSHTIMCLPLFSDLKSVYYGYTQLPADLGHLNSLTWLPVETFNISRPDWMVLLLSKKTQQIVTCSLKNCTKRRNLIFSDFIQNIRLINHFERVGNFFVFQKSTNVFKKIQFSFFMQ